MEIKKYELIVFDVDGTLYYQRKLRLIMAWRLFSYYIVHPHRYKDLLIIKKFRELREDAKTADSVYADTASKLNVTKDRVQEVIKKWIYENPMDAVAKSRDSELLTIIDKIENNCSNIKIAIWSDYEAADKLTALGINCENVYTAEQERVGELKPSPKGLQLIMNDLNITKNKTLMIGDRMEKDGEAALSAGTDYLILSKNKRKRHLQLNEIII